MNYSTNDVAYAVAIDGLFNKTRIYNKRQTKWVNENRYNEILLSLLEQEAVKTMMRVFQFQILEYYYGENSLYLPLNEGMFDSIKKATSNVIDKVKALPGKLKAAYDFCSLIIKSGVTKISEFIKIIAELFSKLGDKVRDAVMKLGGFGENSLDTISADEVTEAQDNDIDKMFKDVFPNAKADETSFLKDVMEYVMNNKNKSEMKLNEGKIGDFMDKLNNNPIVNFILRGTTKKDKDIIIDDPTLTDRQKRRKKIWRAIGLTLKLLLIGIVGTLVITFCVNGVGAALGAAAATVSGILYWTLLIWNGRNILKILLDRRAEMKKNGETKFFNVATIIQLTVTVGLMVVFSIPWVQKWFSDILSIFFGKFDWVTDNFQKVVELLKGKLNPTVEEIEKQLVNVAKDAGAEGANAAKSGLSNEQCSLLQKFLNYKTAGRNDSGFLGRFLNACGNLVQTTEPTLLWNADVNLSKTTDLVMQTAKSMGLDAELTKTLQNEAANGTYYLTTLVIHGNVLQTLIDEFRKKCQDVIVSSTAATHCEMMQLPLKEVIAPILPVVKDAFTMLFSGIMVPSWSPHLSNKIKISFGSETTYQKFFPVTEIVDTTREKVLQDVSTCDVNWNNIGFDKLKQNAKNSTVYVANLYQINDTSNNKKDVNEAEETEDTKEQKPKQIDEVKLTKALSDADTKMLVFYTQIKKDGKQMKLPLIGINYRTLSAVDLIKSKTLGTRENPYFLKGLFNHVTIKPIDDKDTKTKTRIKELLEDVLYNSLKANAELCHATIIGDRKAFSRKKVWKPAEGADNDTNRLELGNFTNNEVCEILNNKEKTYGYLSGKYAQDIHSIDKLGNVTKAKRREGAEKIIEDKIDYIKNKVLPIISCKKTQVWKELANDELIPQFFMKDGEWKEPNGVNILLSSIALPGDNKINIPEMIMRSPETFALETKVSIKNHIANLFHKKSDKTEEFSEKEVKRFCEALQRLASIIWKFKGDPSAWSKQLDIYKKETGKTIKDPDTDNKEQKEIIKKEPVKTDNKDSQTDSSSETTDKKSDKKTDKKSDKKDSSIGDSSIGDSSTGDSSTKQSDEKNQSEIWYDETIKPGSKFIKLFTKRLALNGKFAKAVKQNEILKDAFYTDDKLDMEKINKHISQGVRDAFKKLNRLALKQRKIILKKQDSKVWPKIQSMYKLDKDEMTLLKNFFRVITEQRIAQDNKKLAQLENKHF